VSAEAVRVFKKIGLILLAVAAALIFLFGSIGMDVNWKG